MSDFDDEPPPLIEHDEGINDENDVSYFLFIKINLSSFAQMTSRYLAIAP